jgi:hypothetical protein
MKPWRLPYILNLLGSVSVPQTHSCEGLIDNFCICTRRIQRTLANILYLMNESCTGGFLMLSERAR